MTIRLQQSSQYRRKDWWFWSVWVGGTDSELDGIESVTYYLHPTFPNPKRTIDDRATSFRLDSAGWGGFEVRADVRMRDGSVLPCSHHLTLEYPDEGTTKAPSSPEEAQVAASGTVPSEAARGPVVFLTSSSADSGVASALGTALEARGIGLMDESTFDPGVPWDASIENAIRSSDMTVAIVSDVPSRFVQMEISASEALEQDVMPVVIGRKTHVPPYLGDRLVLRLKDEHDVEQIADQLEERLRRPASGE